MVLRTLQMLISLGNCAFGIFLLSQYGETVLQIRNWPLSVEQSVLLLISASLLPVALVGLRYPVVAGLLQFACAFLGKQLAHDVSPAALIREARISIAFALAILAVATFRGILSVTHEAFEGPATPQQNPRPARKPIRPRRAA